MERHAFREQQFEVEDGLVWPRVGSVEEGLAVEHHAELSVGAFEEEFVLRVGPDACAARRGHGPLVEFDLRQLVYKDLQLTGATIVPPGSMQRVVRLIEQNHLRPLLAKTFPLHDLAQAQQVFLEKKHVGNIVVET